MEDRLSPKAQDQVKKSAKVKSAISDKIVEDRKRASESKQTDHFPIIAKIMKIQVLPTA